MIRTAVSYFRPDGRYRGTMILFAPEAAQGEIVHPDDGLSIVRRDGTIFHQADRFADQGFTAVPGEYSGHHRLRGGVVDAIPDAEKPLPERTVDQKIAALEAKVAAMGNKA